jgi:hypothetical protein
VDPERTRSEEDPDEVPLDDAVIGRAFRLSLVVVVLGALVAGTIVWFANRPSAEPPGAAPEIGPASVQPEARDAPAVRFTDVTAASGIDFVHFNGARGGKYLPETMGGGCAFFDPDGDGDPDLLLVNGSPWPWDDASKEPPPGCVLYRNDGKGRFEDVTRAVGLGAPHQGTGVAVGDADGDGDPDVLVTGVFENRYYRNDGGRFTDATAEAGLGGPGASWTTSAGFADLDGDGDLDLFVCAYIRWSKEIDEAQNYTLKGVGRAYGPPTSFEGAHCFLYRNDGSGRFADASEAAGLWVTNPATGVPVSKALGLAFLDLEGDGDLDVFVANDTVRNFLFRNDGKGKFEEIGEDSGVAYDSRGAATGAMGTDVGESRNDGAVAIPVGNFASEMTSLYVAPPGTTRFVDRAIVEGIGAPSRKALSFGVFFFDYDLDGRLDLFQTNGHLEQEIHKVQPSQSYEQESQLFWNQGPQARQTYALVPPEKTGDMGRPVVGRAAAYADVDGDGDPDVLLTQVGRAPLLLRNDQALGHHWLAVRVVGKAGNPEAIGARVELTAGGVAQRRMVMPTRSYLSQCFTTLLFGLGSEEKVERLRVTWPDGTTREIPVEGVDRVLLVR